MDPYDASLAPSPFGLKNTGAICYLNSYLQMLAGCSALTRALLGNPEYAGQTRTGTALIAYFRAFAGDLFSSEDGAPAAGIAELSSKVLAALMADLAERCPDVDFGRGQESASELFVYLLDMMEPSAGGASPHAHITSIESPITRLFLHRFRCDLHCRKCRKIVSTETDYAVVFNLFHLDQLREPPTAVADFSKSMRLQVSETNDFKCPGCVEVTAAIRVYTLTMVPEIIICAFNLYVGYGGARRARYFPERVEFPAVDGGKLAFRIVGQIEHTGGLSGGHYWARGLRAGGNVYLLNDTGVTLSTFKPTPSTYMIAYHFEGHEAAP